MTGTRILIADDEAGFLHSTATLLRREGFTVDTASDASSAAALVTERAYDVLIADIKMPGNPSLELIDSIAATGMQVIIVTGYPTVHSAVRALRLPVTAYLVKPVDFPELLDQVRDATRRKRVWDAVARLRSELAARDSDLQQVQGLTQFRSVPPGMEEEAVVSVSLQNVGANLREIQHVLQALPRCGPADPQLELAKRALRETVRTLEKTKSAFKSKDLGSLRRELEQVLAILDGNPPAGGSR